MNKAPTVVIRNDRNAIGLQLCIERLTQLFAAAEAGRLNIRCPLVPIFDQGIFQQADVEENKKDRITIHEQPNREPARTQSRR